ncbi:MAG: septum formation initiator family protein [Tannerellaceae bacterium]|jgi:cell division protein FtsB|nr:septum formation initiator family protein [Tannerellaceae bacterium]
MSNFFQTIKNKFLSKANIYAVILVLFVTATFTVGDSNLYVRAKYDEEIRSLEREIVKYKDEAEQNRLRLMELRSNEADLERVAREEYLMKKPNEDVFLVK